MNNVRGAGGGKQRGSVATKGSAVQQPQRGQPVARADLSEIFQALRKIERGEGTGRNDRKGVYNYNDCPDPCCW